MPREVDGSLGRMLLHLLAPPGHDLDAAVAPAVARRLAGLFLDGVSLDGARPRLAPASLDRLRGAARREAADDRAIARETAAVLGILAPLAPVVLKGRALALEVWPRPEQRPPGDLDLLADAHAIEAAVAMLRAHGYRPAPQPPRLPLRRPDTGIALLPPAGGRLVVDLHERLFRSVGHRIDPARLLARARPALLGDHPVRVLDEADRLLFLGVHAAKHGARDLKWLLDLYAVALRTSEATWRRAARRARATGTTRPLWAAASLLAGLPGLALDENLRALRPAAPWPHLIGALISRDLTVAGAAPSRLENYALELSLEPALGARIRMIAGLLARVTLGPIVDGGRLAGPAGE